MPPSLMSTNEKKKKIYIYIYQAERSPFDKQELGSNILVVAGIDYLEGSANSRSMSGEVPLQPIKESDSSTGLCSQRQRKR